MRKILLFLNLQDIPNMQKYTKAKACITTQKLSEILPKSCKKILVKMFY